MRARIRVWSGGSALKTLGMNSSSGTSGGGDQPGTFLEVLAQRLGNHQYSGPSRSRYPSRLFSSGAC